MRQFALVIALGACNQVFGLATTSLVDAPAPGEAAAPDAPFACPPIGTAPRYSSVQRVALAQDCASYMRADALVVAACDEIISQGSLDGRLVASVGITSANAVAGPRVSPEGDEVFVDTYDLSTGPGPHLVFTALADGSWTSAGQLPMMASNELSNVSRGPVRRVLEFTTELNASSITEWSGDAATWDMVSTTPEAMLGITAVGSLWLSSDARRLVANAIAVGGQAPQMFYADRATTAAAFSPAVPLVGVPVVYDAFVSEDCGRVYFSSQQAIYYVEQQ